MTSHDRHARRARVSSVLGWVATAGSEAHQYARRRRMRSLRLTAAERDMCADELAEQFALGRIDKDELDRRLDLLHRSETRGELGPVFAGLPTLPLDRSPGRSGRWRWIVFAVAAWLAAPFVLVGLLLVAVGHGVAGVVVILAALFWALYWWRWAAVDRGEPGRGDLPPRAPWPPRAGR
jgi:Flp pilus assembly protein TadB